MRHTTYNIQHTTYNIQHTTYNTQRMNLARMQAYLQRFFQLPYDNDDVCDDEE